MRVFAAGRQTGKTEKAIRWASDTCARIVCINRQEAERVFHRAKEMDLEILFPVTHHEFIQGGPQAARYIVDDTDLLIRMLARGSSAGAIMVNSDYGIASEFPEDEPKAEPKEEPEEEPGFTRSILP